MLVFVLGEIGWLNSLRSSEPVQFPYSARREANCTLPPNSAIAAALASWHNNEALADLRHGTVLRPV